MAASLADASSEGFYRDPNEIVDWLDKGGWVVADKEEFGGPLGLLLELRHPSMPPPVDVLVLAVDSVGTPNEEARRLLAARAADRGIGAALGSLKPSDRERFALGLVFRGQTVSATSRLDDLSEVLLSKLVVARDRAEKYSHPAKAGEAPLKEQPKLRTIVDDLSAVSDGLPAKPGLGFDRIASAFVRLLDGVVAEARDREARDDSLITVGIYGPWGSGKSTLMRAVQDALPADAYLPIAINPWKSTEKDSLFGLFHGRTLDQLAPRFLRIRSRTLIRALLWISNHPWLYGSAIVIALFAAAFLIDTSLSWQMVNDLYHAWRTAKPGDELKDVRYIMEWYPVGLMAQLVPWLAACVPFLIKAGPHLVRHLGARINFVSGSTEDLQKLYRDLAKMARSEARTLVFFIDDLDRCTPSRVSEFIESVHSLTAAGCIVFVACDDEYVAAALNAKYREIVVHHRDGKGFGRGFLGKIVQVPFRVPMVDEAGARSVLFPASAAPDSATEAGTASAGARPRPAGPVAESSPAPEIKLEEAKLSAIVGETIGPLVRPLGLNIRFLKSLVATLKLQLHIGGFVSEAEARRLAAAALADAVDPAWLDAHALGRSPPEDSVLALHGDLTERLREIIGTDQADLHRICQRLGRRARLLAKPLPPASQGP